MLRRRSGVAWLEELSDETGVTLPFWRSVLQREKDVLDAVTGNMHKRLVPAPEELVQHVNRHLGSTLVHLLVGSLRLPHLPRAHEVGQE